MFAQLAVQNLAVKLLLRSPWHSVCASILAPRPALQDALESWVLCRGLLLMCDSAICHNPGMPPCHQSTLVMYSFGNEVVEQLFEDTLCASSEMSISDFNY